MRHSGWDGSLPRGEEGGEAIGKNLENLGGQGSPESLPSGGKMPQRSVVGGRRGAGSP